MVILHACARDIENDEHMKAWAAIIRTMPFRFELLANETEKHFRDVALRETVKSRAFLVGRTAYGRMIEVWNFKIAAEVESAKLSSLKIAAMYLAVR